MKTEKGTTVSKKMLKKTWCEAPKVKHQLKKDPATG